MSGKIQRAFYDVVTHEIMKKASLWRFTAVLYRFTQTLLCSDNITHLKFYMLCKLSLRLSSLYLLRS